MGAFPPINRTHNHENLLKGEMSPLWDNNNNLHSEKRREEVNASESYR